MSFGAALARQLVHIEKENLQVLRSMRTAGVAAALPLLAWLAGMPNAMIPLGVGALFVGVAEADLHVAHRSRIMLWTTAWLMATSAIGYCIAENELLVVITSMLVGSASAWAGVAGPRAGLAGLLALVCFTITVGLPVSVDLSLSFIAFLGLGGLVQTAVFLLVTGPRFSRSGTPPLREPASLWFRVTHPGSKRDTYVRHAVTVTIAIGVATIISQYVDVPHQYWIPMTVAWILKSDRRVTYIRVVERVTGTLVAIGIAFLWGEFMPAPDVVLFVIVTAGGYLLLAFLTSNYSIATFGITSFVLALFAIAGDLYEETVVFRLEATLTAGAIVVVVLAAERLWASGRDRP